MRDTVGGRGLEVDELEQTNLEMSLLPPEKTEPGRVFGARLRRYCTVALITHAPNILLTHGLSIQESPQ